ncbi:ABC transporter substrate-binding protein [Nocardioides panacisoli]|uniref:ABC transporter substrate-binding protein n=1 Tax=Nocardioides panacisoli TaxID=627624 RepID=A0ABP7HPQ8_9ACTN
MKQLTTITLGLCVAAAALAGCGGGNGSSSGDKGEVVDGGTFTMAFTADPGNLDPQMSVSTALFSISQLSYDHLLNMDADDGSIQSGLATDWKVDGKTASFTLADGITCSDGSALTATDVADNINFVADPKNKSPFLGAFLPPGAKAEADDDAGTLTITLAAPAPFVLQGLANLPIVCAKGLADRDTLADGTDGTGPYELTDLAPDDQYTYQIRDGYTWGPDGASTDTKGLPDTIVVKIVQNESTAANLLLSGDLNAAIVDGPDRKRLDAAGLDAYDITALMGEQWYNQNEGHATSDPEIRKALTQALDLEQLQKVLTSGNGGPATTLSAIDPVACPGDSVSGALPESDPAAAKSVLEAADLPDLTLLYSAASSAGATAAAELAVQEWADAGVTVKATSQSAASVQQALFGSGDWDIAWVALNVNSPDQLVPFLSGPGVADGGTNFAGIDNDAYNSGVAQATEMTGQDGCDTWLDAESNLFNDADVVPFANNASKVYEKGASFDYPGQMAPMSIRMLAQ